MSDDDLDTKDLDPKGIGKTPAENASLPAAPETPPPSGPTAHYPTPRQLRQLAAMSAPIIDSLTVDLAAGRSVKAAALNGKVAQKVEETLSILKREDRIVWALRHFKKALVLELLWMTNHDPKWFEAKTGSPPAAEQPDLQRQVQEVADVDLSPFKTYDPDEDEEAEPSVTGLDVIEKINETLGRYLKMAHDYEEKWGAQQDNPIHKTVFAKQNFSEIMREFRRGEIILLKKFSGNWEAELYEHPPYDLKDEEGRLETILRLRKGWRWFDLHRKSSVLHGRKTMGHVGNTARAIEGATIYELDEPIDMVVEGKTAWKPHLTFILDANTGLLGEMKGRFNNKPSGLFHQRIFDLLRTRREIKGLKGGGFMPENNFFLKDLPPRYLKILARERPEFWANSQEDQLPGGSRELPR